jgi:hypothetical protein
MLAVDLIIRPRINSGLFPSKELRQYCNWREKSSVDFGGCQILFGRR